MSAPVVMSGPVAAQPAPSQPVDLPPPLAGQGVSLLAPGNSGSVSAQGQLEGGGGGSYGDNLDDQAELYWGLEGYAGQGFADPADAVRMDSPVPGVRIYWDSFGVPAIYGDSGRDVWVGAGYAVAQIRLFLMDAVRRMGRGTFAELVGPSGVGVDVQTRVLTYTDAEYQALYDGLSTEARDAVDGYVEGANAWIDETTSDPTLLPAEYALLTTTPAPLDAIDVLASGVLITRSVASEGGNEMANVEVLRQLEATYGIEGGRDVFTDFVWNDDTSAITTVPAEEGVFSNQPVTDEDAAFQLMADYAAGLPLELATGPGTGDFPAPASGGGTLDGLGGLDPGTLLATRAVGQLVEAMTAIRGGSVAAAIGPSRSRDGGALLLSGPQLGYGFPSLLVELEVHGGGYHARGTSVPALPTVGIGYTDRVAWALTTGFSKTIDSFIETVRDNPTEGGPLQYRHDGAWVDADCRTEEVGYREDLMGIPLGLPLRSVDVEVCRTVHGPIVADQAPVEGQETRLARSVQYHMAGREIDTVEGILAWNRARSLEDFEAAMRMVTWNENTTYADADGHIAYWHPGLHLQRPLDGDLRLPLPGDGSMDLGEPLPFESLPQVVDPVQGYLANWNNKPAVGWHDGVGFGYASRPGGAVQRVTNVVELITSRDDHTLQTLTDLEVEAGLRDPRAGAFLPLISSALEGSEGQLAAVAELLEEWNRRHYDPAAAPVSFGGPGGGSAEGLDSPAATVFDAVVEAIVAELFGSVAAAEGGAIVGRQLGSGGHVYDHSPAHNLALRVLDPSSSALDPAIHYSAGRSADEVVLAAVEAALASLSEGYGSASLEAYRRPTSQSTVASLTGVVGPPSVMQPYMDRGTYIHAIGFDGLERLISERAAGGERVGTSLDASRLAFPSGAEVVVLADSRSFPDALTGAPLAAALDAPLLLVDEELRAPTLEELDRLGASQAVVVGGASAVPAAVEGELAAAGLEVSRVAGDTRFDTAGQVAAVLRGLVPAGSFPGAPDVYVASVSTFADALSIGGVAARTGTPILLTEAETLPAETAEALVSLGAESTVVLGGTAVVSEDVLGDLPGAVRIAGLDRYGTAAAILRHARALGVEFGTLVLATGENFPDGLTAGALAGRLDGVVVLVRGLEPSQPGPALDVAVTQRADIRRVVLMGGTAVMSLGYETAVR